MPGEDAIFDEDEGSKNADADILCAIEALSLQINTTDPAIAKTETCKDPVLVQVMRFISEGWPLPLDSNDPAKQFCKLSDSLSTYH